ncbi:23S rRNA (guanosine(2251)-2'-O)-methyltransferase RlmB [Beijerinckia mobilis]|uniref:23S rRNA (guanosine(2251)-2'-O)-methyltransferase RlmB n=1 Tax=Beijerinckia mobilis TaxID=231434 RepID=UPI001FDA0D72|nr:23S rRNA (guanosine(2251)-2'-O)-methyltransferase RlmB [Beijerinckia mobilis]
MSRQAPPPKGLAPKRVDQTSAAKEKARGKDHPRPERPQPQAPRFAKPGADLIQLYGTHAVREALRAGQRECLLLHATAMAAEKLAPEIAASGVKLQIVTADDLSRQLGPGSVHQGLLLEARPIEPLDVTEIESRSGIVLVLDQITDPHNVGAILRTAAAFAVDAIVITERHAPALGGVLAKTASGGLEHVRMVPVVNLARSLETLGKLGYLRIGLDSAAENDLTQLPLHKPLALVLGGEGAGLRRLTREKCDFLARLDMPGAIKSLNVSNACAVVLTLVQKA